MTRPSKKNRERHFAEEAATRLGKLWRIGADREHPDFVVTEGEQQFGLEVCEIFTGQEDRSGSIAKKEESDTQWTINNIRNEYEAVENVPLVVKFVGNMCAKNMAKATPALVAENLAAKPLGHHVILDLETGIHPRLRVHVTKALRADWFSVNDRVGWVDYNPMARIAAIVGKKSQKLPRYKNAAGEDIRLLVIADRIYNSGKLALENQATLDRKGFRTVYFFSYPESILIFE